MILAFSGHKESGKTTCADWLVKEGGWVKLSFATPLKQEIGDALFPASMIYLKPTPPEMRRLLQAWGDVRRAQRSDYFIKPMLELVKAHTEAGHNVVIDDLRYINEAEALQQEGSVLVRLKKVVYPKPSVGPVTEDICCLHQSEHDLDGYIGFDYYIEAPDGDLGTLRARIMGMVQREMRFPGGVV